MKEALNQPEYDFFFEQAPVALWDEDFSAIKRFLDRLHEEGVQDLSAYLACHQGVVEDCASKIHVKHVNKATLNLYAANNESELLDSLDKTYTDKTYAVLARELVDFDQGKTEFNCEATVKTLDGRHLDIILHASIAPGHESSWDQVLVSITDIRRRKQAEEELRQVNRLARLQSQCNKALIAADSQTQYLEELCQDIIKIAGYKLAWVGQAEHDTAKTLVVIASAGGESGYLQSLKITWSDEPFGRGPTGVAIRNGEIATAQNNSCELNFAPWQQAANRFGYKSSIALPLQCRGKIWGALNIYAASANAFNVAETDLLKDLAADVSHGLEVLADRKQRHETERILRRYRHILSSTSDMLAMLSPDYIYLSANNAYLQAFGKTLDQLVGLSVVDVFGEEYFKTVIRPHGERCLKGETVYFTTWAEYPILGRRYIDVHHYPYIGVDDQVAGIVMGIRDITDYKQEQAKYQSLFQHANDAIFVHDLHGRILEVNHRSCELFGYSQSEWQHLNIADLHHSSVLEASKQAFATIQQQGHVHFETEMMDKSGSVFPVEVSSNLLHLGNETVVQGLVKDITQRRVHEQTRQQLLKQTRQIIDTARDAFVSMDANGLITDWNPTAEQIFGWSREQVLGSSMADTLIAPSHRIAHKQGLKHLLVTGQGRINGHQITGSALHSDGHVFPVRLSVAAVEQDGATRFHAFIHDLSNQAKSQAALQEALFGTVHAVSNAIEARDPYTAGHQRKVAHLASAIGQSMGLSHGQIEGIRMGATIHDLGKIQLPAEMLAKPTALSYFEYEIIKEHSRKGYEIVKDIVFPWPIAEIILQHHERLDGSGYPDGLEGEAIISEARIVAVADVVEAMASHRPYRPALGIDLALEEISNGRGRLFDADVVDACLQLFRRGNFRFP